MSTRDDRWRGVLADVERASTRSGRSQVGCFVIEGFRLHERALRARVAPRSVLVGERLLDDPDDRTRRLLDGLRALDCDLLAVPQEAIERYTGGRRIGALVGLVPIPADPSLPQLLAASERVPAVVLVGAEIEDPGNVGALIRTGLAGGADLFAAIGITEPFHPKAVRTSMGAVFRLPIARYASVEALQQELVAGGVTSYGGATEGGDPLQSVTFGPESVALWVGSEAFGLGVEARAALERLVTIPMHASIDSYSVNAATAILLHEIRRPRS